MTQEILTTNIFEEYLDRIAFPIGGIGSGMICIEGTGAISHVSVRNKPDIYKEPFVFSALCVKGKSGNFAKIIEGQVPTWKRYGGRPASGKGLGKNVSYGLPRFESNTFLVRFPFAEIELHDKKIPVDVSVNGWSPFIPGNADNSSLPVGALEYHFINSTEETHEMIFSFNSVNFMRIGKTGSSVKEFPNGFLLWQEGTKENPDNEGVMAFFVDNEEVKVNHNWFRGIHFDTKTITWNNTDSGNIVENPPIEGSSPGASLYVPFVLNPGEEKKIILKFCWYVPNTNLRKGRDNELNEEELYYKPWYSGKFDNINELANFWRTNYKELRDKTKSFSDAFYASTLPEEVLEAVAANLSILKSSTVLRQTDGRFWAWEGCNDDQGVGEGTCTHVWNYAQALPHLFPELERSIRETEFKDNQTQDGFQNFRALIPIRQTDERVPGVSRDADCRWTAWWYNEGL